MFAKQSMHYLYSLNPDSPDSLRSAETDLKSSSIEAISLVIMIGIDSIFFSSLYCLTFSTAEATDPTLTVFTTLSK